MNYKNILTVGVLGLGVALGLQAQEAKPFAAGLNYVLPLDGLKTITNKGTFGGATADFNYTGMIANSGAPYRASVAVAYFPGQMKDGLKTTLHDYQLAGDLLIKLGGNPNLNLITGLSINYWTRHFYTAADGKVDKIGDLDASVKGPKFGGRFGVDYKFNAKWSANILFQVIELGTAPYGIQGYNPSFITLGAKYHF